MADGLESNFLNSLSSGVNSRKSGKTQSSEANDRSNAGFSKVMDRQNDVSEHSARARAEASGGGRHLPAERTGSAAAGRSAAASDARAEGASDSTVQSEVGSGDAAASGQNELGAGASREARIEPGTAGVSEALFHGVTVSDLMESFAGEAGEVLPAVTPQTPSQAALALAGDSQNLPVGLGTSAGFSAAVGSAVPADSGVAAAAATTMGDSVFASADASKQMAAGGLSLLSGTSPRTFAASAQPHSAHTNTLTALGEATAGLDTADWAIAKGSAALTASVNTSQAAVDAMPARPSNAVVAEPLPGTAAPAAGNVSVAQGAVLSPNASSAAALPEYSLERAPQDPEFAGELTARMKTLLRDGVREARLQLHPAELGRLQVTISTEGDQARVAFLADSSAAKEAIEQSMPRLREMLEQNGLQLAHSDVGQQEFTAQSDASDADGADDSASGSDPNEGQGEEHADDTALHTAVTARMNSARIDTYI